MFIFYIICYIYLGEYIYLSHEKFPHISYLDLLSYHREIVSPVVARRPVPSTLGRKREKGELREAYWGRNGDERRGDVHFSKEQSYITAREKRPAIGRLISKALPPAPFTASLNPRALHEFRHSEPNPSHHVSVPLFRLTTVRHDDEKRRRAQSSL